jgi:hypothetical protein
MPHNEIIIQARRHLARVRDIKRNTRLRRYDGRNNTFTDETLRYHETEAERLMAELPRGTQGLLRDEHDLAMRISSARDRGEDRPELRERLNNARRSLRQAQEV